MFGERESIHLREVDEYYGTVFQIQHFCTDDGPGIRTTVFLKGCHLDCAWCHNPEGKSMNPIIAINLVRCIKCGGCATICNNHRVEEGNHFYDASNCIACGKCIEICPAEAISFCGKHMTVSDVMEQVLADKGFYEGSGGGVTISGGEMLLQPEFSHALLKAAKEEGIHTCMETSGAVKYETLAYVAEHADLLLYDIKEIDDENHKKYVGIGNKLILDNLRKLNQLGKKVIIRCPMIPGVNDRNKHFDVIARLYNELECIQEVQILPYHELGTGKQDRYGIKMEIEQFHVPDEKLVIEWKAYLKSRMTRKGGI